MNIKTRLIFSILPALVFFVENINGQGSQTNRLATAHKISSKILVDGLLDEGIWQSIPALDSFINKWPTDNGTARLQTEVRVAYDEQFIYFGFKAYLADKNPVIQSLKRDVNPYYSDGVSVVIDPSGKSTSGYTFGVNAAGAQAEGIVEVNSASFDWDTKWYSATKIFKGYWTAEFAIPFKSLRFPNDKLQWGLNFIRNDMTNNCFSTWNQVPIQFFGANLNCLGKIEFADDVPKVRSNNVFIPYVSGKVNEDQKNFSNSINAGLDARLSINSSLNLAATINPDFSQVDVDRQIINLDRFDVLLPERRTFFLENSDLFSNIGLQNSVSPFVSRRIGLTNDGRIVPILAGVRLTGNLNPGLRIGLMNMQTEGKYGQAAQNYTVAVFDQKIFKRSNFRGLVTNRQEVNGGTKKETGASFNRVAGAEFNLLSNNTKFNGRTGYYHSFNPWRPASAGFAFANIGYVDKRINISGGWSEVNENFIADAGFTPRLYNYDAVNDTTVRIGYNHYNAAINYSFYPKSKAIVNSVDFFIKTNDYYSTSGNFIEFNAVTGFSLLFANRREAALSYTQNEVSLPFATIIIPETGLSQKAKYNFGFLQLKFLSNILRRFSWGATYEKGRFYNGKRTTYSGSIKYRSQRWGVFSADFIYNDILLNERKVHPIIIGPTAELSFSNTFSWTTFLQYNTQIKNFNLNSRLQWRFKAMSDIYLVYADNYITEGFLHKSRNLVFKINYWFN